MAGSTCPMCRETHRGPGWQNVLASLAAAPRRLAAAVRRASPARLTRRPAPREWSVGEVLAHLLDAEVVQLLPHWTEHDLDHLEQIRTTLAAPARR